MTYPGAPGQPPHDPYSQYTPPPGYPTGQHPTYPHGTQQWPLPAPPAPKPKPKWPWIAGGVVFLLFIIGVSGNRQTTTAPTATPATIPAAPTVTRADSTTPAAAAAPPVASGPQTSFGDGTWVVGEDIEPGTYKSTGAKPGIIEFCSVTTLAGDTSDSDIIDWVTANANEPVRIKVTGKVKAVKATGCEDFTKVG
ncbi:hypothetical protein [Pseudonocardia sp.]|uniref:hypothetical protein n=1 Tax=Pseudonocardia sp. TaxID=60912 RepID=UPI003D0B2861